jgi:hypothetical protein
MKKIGLSVIIAIAFFSAWHIHSKSVQNRRESAYRETLAPFQRDLRAGMTRAEVQSYLDSRKVTYRPVFYGAGNAWSYETKIGEEPGNSLACESWSVYVAFDFSSSGQDIPELSPLPKDTLNEIRIRKFGTCL